MARVTIEDCLNIVKDRFEIVMLASRRTRDLLMGASPTIDAPNDKPEVIALRELAMGHLNLNFFRKRMACHFQNIPMQDGGFDEMEYTQTYSVTPVDIDNEYA